MSTTLDSLIVQIKNPSEDALPDLEKAHDAWVAMLDEDRKQMALLMRRSLRGQATSEERNEFVALLAKHRPMMDALASASKKPACSVLTVETWQNRKESSFWNFVREGARFFAAEAVLRGQEHDLAGAEKLLVRAADLTKHLTAQPSYLPMMRRSSSEIEVLRAAERVVFANGKSPQAGAELLARFDFHFDPVPSAAQVIAGELPLILDALGDSKRTGLEGVPAGEYLADVGKSGSLEIWNRYYKKLPSDPEDQTQAERVLRQMDQEANDTPFYGSYVNGYHRIMPTLRDLLARHRLADVAQRYLATGEFGEMPDDPHSEGKLLIQRRAAEWVVYSVGRDGQDDGGAERKFGPGASPNFDILFRLPILEKAAAK